MIHVALALYSLLCKYLIKYCYTEVIDRILSCVINHGNFTGFRQIMGSNAFFKSEISHYIGHIGSCLSNIFLYKNVIL